MVEQTHTRVARHQIERIHSESFADWFAKYVSYICNDSKFNYLISNNHVNYF